MEGNEYAFIPLIERKDLSADVIALLNQEWPRSEASRENSLLKSMNASPPMSFVMVKRNTGRLVGHARLCPLLSDERGCWIESVIVSTDMRNRGLGRIIMQHLENAARNYGFKKCYLSTEDKRPFYEKCGYECCEPVLNAGSNSVLLNNPKLRKLFAEVEQNELKKDAGKTNDNAQLSSKVAVCSNTAPPAPPPPPSLLCSQSSIPLGNRAKRTQYMCKVITIT